MPAASSIALAALAAASIGASVYSADQNRKAQNEAQDKAQATALRQEKVAEEASNKANSRRANASDILAAAQQAGKEGPSGTMLTGPGGIDPSSLALGKNSLLGS